MAKELQPIQRVLSTPTQNVSSGNAFDSLASSTSRVSSLIAQKASSLAVEDQARKGIKDAQEGVAPEKLAYPLNAGTKAYNDAVAHTEANRMLLSAQQQIEEAYLNHSNPANFNSQSPAQFSATLQGIVEGTLQNSREETRSMINDKLSALASHAQIKMLDHSIRYDNAKTQADFQTDINNIARLRRNATIAGDDELATQLDYEIDQTLKDYSVRNQTIANQATEIKRKLDEDKQVTDVLGEFAKASSENAKSEFLNDFAQNKQNLPYDVWSKTAKELVAMQGQEQKLTHDIAAQSLQQGINAIDNGSINDVDQILDIPNLTATQHLQLINRYETRQRQGFKSQEKVLNAQNHILRNQSAMVPGNVADDMFQNAQAQFEQGTGQVMTLTDMVESALGLNAYPASGMPGMPFGRDIPAINAQMKSQLQSTNPTLVREAAELFGRVVNTDQNANAINISGRPLDIATLFNQLNKGQEDPNLLAKEVRDTVMNVSEKQSTERAEYYHRNFEVSPRTGKSKLDKKFKEITGVNPQIFKTDAALDFFKAEYRLSYLNSNSEEAADKAVKYKMRSWGTSKYFDDGLVAQPVPEKELNITQIGNAFDNQYRIRLQGIIDSNKELIDRGVKTPKIEWLQPKEQNIDVANLTDEQRVFSKLGTSLSRTTLRAYGEDSRPHIKVDGLETQVYLVPGPESRLGERVQYAMFYKDKFGNQQPIPDVNSPTGVAMFSPDGLEEYAPAVLDERNNQKLKEQALKIQRAQAKQELDDIQGLPALGALFPSIDMKLKYIRDPERTSEAFRKYFSSDAKELQDILRQKIQSNKGNTASATEADNVGVAADSGQPIKK